MACPFRRRCAATLTAAQTREFKGKKIAWDYWRTTPPSYQKVMIYWIISAKKEATRERRFVQLVELCMQGKRAMK